MVWEVCHHGHGGVRTENRAGQGVSQGELGARQETLRRRKASTWNATVHPSICVLDATPQMQLLFSRRGWISCLHSHKNIQRNLLLGTMLHLKFMELC